MKRYQKIMWCPKCRSDLVTTDYLPAMNLMKRKCSACGYEEYQTPLDSEQDTTQVKVTDGNMEIKEDK
jgi:hypothetical protein